MYFPRGFRFQQTMDGLRVFQMEFLTFYIFDVIDDSHPGAESQLLQMLCRLWVVVFLRVDWHEGAVAVEMGGKKEYVPVEA